MSRTITPEWKETRELVLDRDGHECQKCGSEEELHVHHILPYENGGTDDPENLVTVCFGCHQALHMKGKKVDGEIGLELIDGPIDPEPSNGYRNQNLRLEGARLQVVEYLMENGQATVSKMDEDLDIVRSTIHHQLRVLRTAGIVTRESRGEYRYIP